MKKILISTGGSGGHVIPALNLYDFLKEEFDVKLYTDVRGAKYITKEIDKTIFEVKQIPDKIYFLPIKVIFLFFAFIKSIIHLIFNKFEIIISTGGYMSLPLVLAAKFFNKKIFLLEPNSIIGKSNKFLLNLSNKIFCYDKNIKGINPKFKGKIIEISPILQKCFYRKMNNSDIGNDVLKILIIGGSQASLFFSKNLKSEIIKLAQNHNIEITQQISQGYDLEIYKQEYNQNNIKNNLFFFEDNFLCKNHNYDIAISRSGASSLAELAHCNIPFIAIPFPYATDNHQYLNAKRYHDLNCCWILEEKNFKSGDICRIINEIINNKKNYIEVKKNLKKYFENKNLENVSQKLKRCLNDN